MQLTVVNKNVLSYDICGVTLSNGGFSFFSQEGWKNFRWGASDMQYAILDALEGA